MVILCQDHTNLSSYTNRWKRWKIINHYVYLTINNINNKHYVGKRSCKTEIQKDGYLGSGKRLKKAIKKYGRENFSKYIIEEFDDIEDCFNFERELIYDLNAVADPMYYNLVPGGKNGCEGRVGKLHPMFNKKHSEYSLKKMSASRKGELNHFYGKYHTEKTKKVLAEKCANFGEDNGFYGKHHTEDTRKVMSEYAKNRTGLKNPFYGKKHTEDTRRRISESNKGKTKGTPKSEEHRKKLKESNHKRKEVIVNGVRYSSITDAMKGTGIYRHKISKMAKDDNNDDVRFV